jgi:hypothetical protein
MTQGMSSDEPSAEEQLASLARSLVDEITTAKAVELARSLAADAASLPLAAPRADAPPPGTEPGLGTYIRQEGWHPTLADPAQRSHLLGYPGNRTHTLGWQMEQALGRDVAAAHDPSAARPAAQAPAPRRRRRRRW